MAQEGSQQEPVSSTEILKTERYLWIARAFAAVAVLSIVANILLFSALGSLYPLVRVQPFYLDVQDKNQQVVNIKSPKTKELEDRVLQEALVRQYVLARYSIQDTLKEMNAKWGNDGIIFLMSSQNVWNDFQKDRNKWLEEIEKQGLQVTVKITSAQRKREARGEALWQVEMILERQLNSYKEPDILHYVDDVRIRFDPLFRKSMRQTWQDRLRNPLGFRVVEYGSKRN